MFSCAIEQQRAVHRAFLHISFILSNRIDEHSWRLIAITGKPKQNNENRAVLDFPNLGITPCDPFSQLKIVRRTIGFWGWKASSIQSWSSIFRKWNNKVRFVGSQTSYSESKWAPDHFFGVRLHKNFKFLRKISVFGELPTQKFLTMIAAFGLRNLTVVRSFSIFMYGSTWLL